MATSLHVGGFAEDSIIAPHREMSDTLGDHVVTTGAGVVLHGARFAYRLHGPRLTSFDLGAPKTAQNSSGINLFVLVLGARGTIAAGNTLKPKARTRRDAA